MLLAVSYPKEIAQILLAKKLAKKKMKPHMFPVPIFFDRTPFVGLSKYHG